MKGRGRTPVMYNADQKEPEIEPDFRFAFDDRYWRGVCKKWVMEGPLRSWTCPKCGEQRRARWWLT
jgi:hypothetical protein